MNKEEIDIEELVKEYIDLVNEMKKLQKVININTDAFYIDKLLDIYVKLAVTNNKQINDIYIIINDIIIKYTVAIKEYCNYINKSYLFEKLKATEKDDIIQSVRKLYSLRCILYHVRNNFLKKQLEEKIIVGIIEDVERMLNKQ